jgi:hypothetical protein
MAGDIQGMPCWEVGFDERARPHQAGRAGLAATTPRSSGGRP